MRNDRKDRHEEEGFGRQLGQREEDSRKEDSASWGRTVGGLKEINEKKNREKDERIVPRNKGPLSVTKKEGGCPPENKGETARGETWRGPEEGCCSVRKHRSSCQREGLRGGNIKRKELRKHPKSQMRLVRKREEGGVYRKTLESSEEGRGPT